VVYEHRVSCFAILIFFLAALRALRVMEFLEEKKSLVSVVDAFRAEGTRPFDPGQSLPKLSLNGAATCPPTPTR